MLRNLFQTLYVLSLGGYVVASGRIRERYERRVIERLSLEDLHPGADEEALVKIARLHPNVKVACTAARLIQGRAHKRTLVYDADLGIERRIAALPGLGEQELLRIVLEDDHILMRVAATEQLRDATTFEEIRLKSVAVTVRLAAARTCKDPEILTQYLRDRDERVRYEARASLKGLGMIPSPPTAPGLH